MSTILYGNLTVEIIDALGTRIEHAKGGPAAPDLLTLRPSEIPRAPLMRGRARVGRCAERPCQREPVRVQRLLRRCGLVSYGDVASQDPEGGTAVSDDSIVIIQACDAMPDVVGTSGNDATASLQSLGLTVNTANSGCAAPDLGDVVVQAPGAGAAAPPGSAVTLTICTEAIRQ